MLKPCPCNHRVTKKSYCLLLLLFPLVFGLKARAQDSTSVIVLPHKIMTYADVFALFGKQWNIPVSHDWDLPELNGICNLSGAVTFIKIFKPLRTLGLTFQFITDNVGGRSLIIKRAGPAPVKFKTFSLLVVDGETGEPLPGVTAWNPNTGDTVIADSFGKVHFRYIPVDLGFSYVGMHTAYSTIEYDNTIIHLDPDVRSMDAASVTGIKVKNAFATPTYTTIVKSDVPRPYSRSTHLSSEVVTSTVPTMLEGEVPGVLTTASSGIPGSYTSVSVRGQASILNGNEPFYVVDGVPRAAGNVNVSYLASGLAGKSQSPWSYVSPADIERIDVLRDGDATAIYGSRGANGVILITTKRWKAGLPKWDVALSTGTSMVQKQPAFLNTREYLALRREALRNSGLAANDSTAPDLAGPDTLRNFDWGKWLLGRVAQSSNVRLAVSGGGRMNNYTLGIEYLKEGTPFPTEPAHDRFSGHFNFNHRSRDRRFLLQTSGLAGWDANHEFITFDPTMFRTTAPDAPPVLDQSGQLNFPPNLPFNNPLSQIRQPYEALSDNYLFSAFGSYALSDHLGFKTTVGLNHIRSREFGEMPLASQDPLLDPTAMGFFSTTRFDSRIFEPQLEYSRRYGALSASWLAGVSIQRWDQHANARTDTGYASDAALLHHEYATPIDTSSLDAHETYTGLFANLNGNYCDRYILNVTARRDGSTRFPAGSRSANFGSAAFAWVFTDAAFIRRWFPYVSYGKIKVSEGVTGSNEIGDRSIGFVAGTSIQSFQTIPGLYPSTPTSMGYERTYKSELSLNLGFLQNRILFNATAYRHRSGNELQGMGLMTRVGAHSASLPVVLENSGYELSLSATIADKNYFGWDVAVNWTIPRNKLVSFPMLANSSYAGRLVVGQSINVLRGYVYKGVSQQSGLDSFADLNGDGRITDADQRVVGKFDVTGFGGFSNTIRWRQFQFQVLVDARVATGLNYLAPIFANNTPGSLNAGLSSNVPRVLLDHWRQPGDKATYQRLYAGFNAAADSTMQLYLRSSALLANTSFLRLRKVSFVYDLPSARVAAMHLSALSFFLDAQNLFTLSPYKADPEIQSVLTMPPMRTVEVGIRLTH